MLHHLKSHVYGDWEGEIGVRCRKQIPPSNYVPPNVSLAHSFTISKLLATSDGTAASTTGILVQEPPVLGTAQALLLLSYSWNVFLIGKEIGERGVGRRLMYQHGRDWERREGTQHPSERTFLYLCF